MNCFASTVQIIADTLTALLGLWALRGLVFHRKKINAFVKLLAHSVINDRIKRIKGTLGELDTLDYNVKEQRKEILAVLGELAGMVKGFSTGHSGFKNVYENLVNIAEQRHEVSEPTKRRLCAEIHTLLDDHSVAAAVAILEDDDGRKTTTTS